MRFRCFPTQSGEKCFRRQTRSQQPRILFQPLPQPLLIPDMTNEEEQMLDEALIRTYGKFGIKGNKIDHLHLQNNNAEQLTL